MHDILYNDINFMLIHVHNFPVILEDEYDWLAVCLGTDDTTEINDVRTFIIVIYNYIIIYICRGGSCV